MQPYFVKYYLGGQEIEDVVERDEVSIQVDFRDVIQGNIETYKFTFVNRAFQIIEEYKNNGLTGGVGIFEGLDFKIVIQEGVEQRTVFEGFLDFETYENLMPLKPKILCKVKKEDGLNSISERLQGLTFAYLRSINEITPNDYDYVESVVEKKFNVIETLFLVFAIYSFIQQIITSTRNIAQNIGIIAGITSGSTTGGLGAIVYAIASIIFDAAFIAFSVIAIKNLVEQILESILSPVKDQYCINYNLALTKIFKYLGYEFITNIEEVKEEYYLPSKAEDRENIGIPFDSDYGFFASEFLELALNRFNAKIFVNGKGQIEMRSELDDYFQLQSNYILPDVLDAPFSYNVNELKESRLISFDNDISEDYTLDNYQGTSYVITTKPITENNPKNTLITGFVENRFNICLGTAKTEFNSVENALTTLLETVDELFEFWGAKSSSVNVITNRLRTLKTSTYFFNKPKLIRIQNHKIAVDNREKVNAKYYYDNYIDYNSFVQNNYKKQHKVFSGVVIPFSYDNYKQLLENSYFTTNEGKLGRINSLNWIIGADTAEIDFYIEEIYTRNLKEEFTETK